MSIKIILGTKKKLEAELDRRELEQRMQAIADQRQEHIDKYAAAFFKEVGAAEASHYELVEHWEKQPDGSFLVHWYYQKRPELSRLVKV